ncbi:aminotransferase class V-fold PLP-dependent enzyme, partial [Salmonella enterica]|uniref:aminotransferase class V-fold PLP-dependent enzyme n=1 Tax=Salmonella enterica TaxID=28901 RepID=UPI003D298286
IERPYEAIAHLLNAHPEEIALASSATRAWQHIFYALRFRPGDRILTAQAEYASNYIAYLQMAQKTGAIVEALPNDERGQLCLTTLQNRLDERVKLI